MTIDPFKNHFRAIRLLRISDEIINNQKSDLKSFILVEGTIMNVKMHAGLFTELLVQDELSSLCIPVITFDNNSYEIKEKIACVGFIHFNWLPDYRCSAMMGPYESAIKSEIIKRR